MKINKIISLLVAMFLIVATIPALNVSAAVSLSTKEQLFINAVLNGDSSLNLSGYKMTVNQLNEAEKKLLYLHPEVWHYYSNCNYNYSGNYVTKITSFNYKNGYTKSSIKSSLKEIEDLTNPIFAGIKYGWSDVEKALYFHDYICVNYYYDNEIYGIRENANFHMYELLTEGKGVCQSYSFLYKYLLDRVGIENYVVVSDIKDSDHAWNVDNIGGKWYHVDVTYGDPIIAKNKDVTLDFYGQVEHNYFLLSNSQINDGNHNNWYNPLGTNPVCVDYTGGELWQNADSAIVYENGYWYYLDYDAGGLVRTDDFSRYTYLASLENKWYKGGNKNSWYYGYYSGIAAYNGRIFYTDSYRIYSYDIANHNVDQIAYLNTMENGSFFGFVMNGKEMNLLITKDIFNYYTKGNYSMEKYVLCNGGHGDFAAWRVLGNGKIYNCSICGAVFDFTDEISGDADGNGKVDTVDLGALKLALAGVSSCKALADMDKNGVVNTTDLANLKLKLAGIKG